MKTVLIFKNPEDEEALYYAQRGLDYSIVLEELDNWLRNLVKYKDQSRINIEAVRKKIYELKLERDLK